MKMESPGNLDPEQKKLTEIKTGPNSTIII